MVKVTCAHCGLTMEAGIDAVTPYREACDLMERHIRGFHTKMRYDTSLEGDVSVSCVIDEENRSMPDGEQENGQGTVR